MKGKKKHIPTSLTSGIYYTKQIHVFIDKSSTQFKCGYSKLKPKTCPIFHLAVKAIPKLHLSRQAQPKFDFQLGQAMWTQLAPNCVHAETY